MKDRVARIVRAWWFPGVASLFVTEKIFKPRTVYERHDDGKHFRITVSDPRSMAIAGALFVFGYKKLRHRP